MKWYENLGENQSFIISSRIRLARNINEFPFRLKMKEEDFSTLLNDIIAAADKNKIFEKKIRLRDESHIKKLSLFEKHLISASLVKTHDDVGLIFSDDYHASVMVGEEDHLRIQILKPGEQLESMLEEANEIDDYFASKFDYAYDEQLGYLTECPTNLGTGLRASAMIHLPMMEANGRLARLTQDLAKLGFTIRGTFGEGTKAVGAFYQVSNQISLGVDEGKIISQLSLLLAKLSEEEKALREASSDIYLEDKIHRAYGILSNAKIMQVGEFMSILSLIRLGVWYGYFPQLNLADIDSLFFRLGDANLSLFYEGRDKNKVRAEILKDYLLEKKEV